MTANDRLLFVLIRLRRLAIARHDLVAVILLNQRIRHAHV